MIIIELILKIFVTLVLVSQEKVNGRTPDTSSRPVCIYSPDVFKWLALSEMNSCTSIPASRSSELG